MRPDPAPPAVGRLPLLPSLLHARRDRLGFLERAAAAGDVVRFRLGPRLFFLVSHPGPAHHVLRDRPRAYRKGVGLLEAKEFMGQGMLTADGAVWARQREAAQPHFRAACVEGYAPLVAAAAGRMVARWERAAGAGTPVDGMAEAGVAALEVVLGALFHTPPTGREAELAGALAEASEYAMRRMTSLFAFTAWLPTRANRRFRRARAVLHAFAGGLGDRPGALLARLPAGGEPGEEEGAAARRRADEIVTLLLAGHETTATTLAWTWHLLAANPALQERVRAEACALPEGCPGSPASLPFTGLAVREALRLYPPVWLIPRVAAEPDVVGGQAVPAGAHVLVSPYTVHRHPALWREPRRFDPDRFGPGRAGEIPPHAYFPFGLGERACIGSRLAMLEAQLLVAATLRRFRVEPAPGPPVRPEALLTLRPRGGLPLRLRAVRS